MTDKILLRPVSTPAGKLLLGAFSGKLCLCDWHREDILARLQRVLGVEALYGDSAVTLQAESQLREYFEGRRRNFTVPLLMAGTAFQESVWRALLDIPYGTTTTYASVAITIGRPKAVRAVAAAIGANAMSVFVPCHRVIGADGSLTGYAGGLDAKRVLIDVETASRPVPIPLYI